MISITVGANDYNLVALPDCPGPADMVLGMTDGVAVVESPYVPSAMQQYRWPGADRWDGQVTLPPLSDDQAAEWEGFLSELRGTFNVFQIGHPLRKRPRGAATGAPVAAAGNVALSDSLLTSGWTPSTARQLLRGTHLQVGYRLYRVCETVSSDPSGNITIPVWPSLREAPSTGTQIVLNGPKGLFRLADNRRQSESSRERLTSVSFRMVEAR